MKKKKKVVVLTGAGVSQASGIPTFRDNDGYWTKKKQENVCPETFLTLCNFTEEPMEIWEWLEDFYCTKNKCKPNLGHASIDALCSTIIEKGGQACIGTQNIDNFHKEAQKVVVFNEK